MAIQAGILFLHATLLASLITPTEYSIPPNVSTKKNRGCGNTPELRDNIGTYECHPIDKYTVACELHCPKNFAVSDRTSGIEFYSCTHKYWKRNSTEKAYCIAKVPVRNVEQNLHSIVGINNLITTLLRTSYQYLAMASIYDRADIALPGFSKMMTHFWASDVKHARNLLSYLNKRGGYIDLMDIPRPWLQDKLIASEKPGLNGTHLALEANHEIIKYALKLQKSAKEKNFNDPHLKHILEDGIISDKTDVIKKLADLITKLRNYDDQDYKIGEYLIDLDIGSSQGQSDF